MPSRRNAIYGRCRPTAEQYAGRQYARHQWTDQYEYRADGTLGPLCARCAAIRSA